MIKTLVTIAAVAVLAFTFAAPGARATGITFTTVAGSDGDGPLAGTVSFTPVAGGIVVTVTNTETGTLGKGQAISAFTFSVSGIGTPTAFTELSGVDEASATIGSGGTWNSATTGTAFDNTSVSPFNSVDHWGFTATGSTVNLATAGSSVETGNPHWMILPSTGTAGPGSSLDNSNFDPYIIGPGMFFLTDAGVTAPTDLTNDISGVTVGFGTSPDKTLGTGPGVPFNTPETTSLLLSGLGLLSALFVGRKMIQVGQAA